MTQLSTARGYISQAEDNASALVASSATLQEWFGCADEETVKARIYLDGLPDEPNKNERDLETWRDELRPFAVVYTPEELGIVRTRIAGGGTPSYITTGQIIVQIEDNAGEDIAGKPGEVGRRFKNNAGQFMQDIEDRPDLLFLSSLQLQTLIRSDTIEEPTSGDFVLCVLLLSYGLEAE